MRYTNSRLTCLLTGMEIAMPRILRNHRDVKYGHMKYGWLGGTTGSASDQRSEGCGFEAY